jgi:hypothetical protein
MPSIKNMNDQITKIHNKINEYSPQEYSEIPDIYKFDAFGNDFLRYDSGNIDSDRVVIFILIINKKYLLILKFL